MRRLLRPILGKGYFRLPGLRSLARLVRRLYRPASITIDGRRLWLNPEDAEVSGVLAIRGEYERREIDRMLGVIGPGDTVVDVGAHIGYVTLMMSAAVGEAGRVIALEPDPTNLRYLRRTVEGLPEKNVEIHPVAIWREEGEMTWHRSATNTGDHSLLPSGERSADDVRVRTARLDDLIAPGTNIRFLKMDVQGAEGAAFEGMERIMRESPPETMLVELMPHVLREAGEDPEQIVRTLLDRGYDLRMISEYDEIDEPITDYGPIADYCREEWRFVNLFCRLGS